VHLHEESKKGEWVSREYQKKKATTTAVKEKKGVNKKHKGISQNGKKKGKQTKGVDNDHGGGKNATKIEQQRKKNTQFKKAKKALMKKNTYRNAITTDGRNGSPSSPEIKKHTGAAGITKNREKEERVQHREH